MMFASSTSSSLSLIRRVDQAATRTCDQIYLQDFSGYLRAGIVDILTRLEACLDCADCTLDAVYSAIENAHTELDSLKEKASREISSGSKTEVDFKKFDFLFQNSHEKVDQMKTVPLMYLEGTEFGERIKYASKYLRDSANFITVARLDMLHAFETEGRQRILRRDGASHRFIVSSLPYLKAGIGAELDKLAHKAWLKVALWIFHKDLFYDQLKLPSILEQIYKDVDRLELQVKDNILFTGLLNQEEREQQIEWERTCHLLPVPEVLRTSRIETAAQIMGAVKGEEEVKRSTLFRPLIDELRVMFPELDDSLNRRPAGSSTGNYIFSGFLTGSDCDTVVKTLMRADLNARRCNSECVDRFLRWRAIERNDSLVRCVQFELQQLSFFPQ